MVFSKCRISLKNEKKNLPNLIFFEKKSSSRQKIGPSGQTVDLCENFVSMVFKEDKIAVPTRSRNPMYLQRENF